MSFAGDVKTELCRAALSRRCCAQAEAYGVLLYCNTFSGGVARVVTEQEALIQRLPALFKKAFKIRSEERRVGKSVAYCVDLGGRRIIKKSFFQAEDGKRDNGL